MSGTVGIVVHGQEIVVPRALVPKLTDDQREVLYRCATDFRYFLTHWRVQSGELHKEIILGAPGVLWSGQEKVVQAMQDEDWIIVPKARKLGVTTLETAFDGWVTRFRPASRVAAVSHNLPAAIRIRDAVYFGLRNLPPFLQLPIQATKQEITLQGGGTCTAFPATERSAIDISATHVHLDELGKQIDPDTTWQAIQPSAAGSLHILSTVPGPESLVATLYRKASAGDSRLHPVFLGALEREGRDQEWLDRMRRDLGPGRARLEYPVTVEDILLGSAERFFPARDVDAAPRDAIPFSELPAIYLQPRPLRHGHREGTAYTAAGYDVYPPVYSCGVDVGVSDAFVITTIEHSGPCWDVCGYVRETGLTYPEMAAHIEQTRARFPGVHIRVETNSAGAALLQMLPFPVEGAFVSARSKQEMLFDLQAILSEQTLKIPAPECDQLLQELYSYAIPDHALIQDSVMSLAHAVQAALNRKMPGRVLGVIRA